MKERVIMMNWFKKIISKINLDDIEEEEKRAPEQERIQTDKVEIKTRMTYEYPKGPFRFPLIPNEHERRPRGKIVSDKTVTDMKEIPVKQRSKIKREHTYVQREKTEKVNQKIEPQMKQPFKPAVIPSPVHGFKRPERISNESIEVNKQIHLDDQRVEKLEPVVKDGENEWIHEDLNNTEIASKSAGDLEKSDKQEITFENNVAFDNPTPIEAINDSDEYVLEEDSKESEDMIEQKVAVEEPPQWDELASNLKVENSLEKNKAEENNEEMKFMNMHEYNTNIENPANKEELHPDSIIISEENLLEESGNDEIDLIDETEINDEENLAEKVNEIVHHSEVAAVIDNPVHEAKAMSEKMVDEIEVEVENETTQQNSSQDKKENSRKHIPFNVLMLKKDRQMLQNKSEENKGEKKEAAVPSAAKIEIYEDSINQNIYQYPHLDLLEPPVVKTENKEWLDEQTALLDETLMNFNVNASVVRVSQGPSVTRFEVQPDRGVKVSKIKNLTDDIKLSMAAKDIRMEAPIPGKRSIGIELPNHESRPVQISEIIGDDTFTGHRSPLTAALGLDISGLPVVTDLSRMPHGLIAGATGSGKSVCINSILVSLLYKARPDELKLLLIDPKMVELTPYNEIPHLVSPVITDVKAATAALKWAVDEMERRYELFAHASVRDITRFNELAMKSGSYADKLPFIVVVIDELADLMMMAPTDVEESICRIAQKARACGIHLIIATQRPSVDVITGLIKANVPARIAFSVSSQVDSRTIIDISGAEKLLGRGDMLFLDSGTSKPVRLQGTFVSDEEIDRVIAHARSQGKPDYLFEQEELLKKAQVQEEEDELFLEACEFVVDQGSASTSLLQRHFRVGYNRASRLMLMMEQRGIISEARGSKARDVLIDGSDLEHYKESLVQ